MKYIIDFSSKQPAYFQLYKQIRKDIVNNFYTYKTKLPSERILAEETGVSIITIKHAYAMLCDEGYAEAKERSGYFVIFRSSNNFSASPDNSNQFIPLPYHRNISASAEFPFSVLTKTMRKVISDLGEIILERPQNEGCAELRDIIRQYLARNRGINTSTEQIIIGSGSEYLYGLIVELLGRNKKYAIEFPSYKKIEQIYRAADVAYSMLPLEHDGIESSALWSADADVLHVSPYRSFPSGVTASASKKHEYLRWANEGNRFIIEDDFESEFSISSSPTETLFASSSKNNVIYINTFSKTISPALRIAYMVLPKHLAVEFEKKLGFYSCTVPTYIQFVVAKLIISGEFERHINRVRRKKRKELSEK